MVANQFPHWGLVLILCLRFFAIHKVKYVVPSAGKRGDYLFLNISTCTATPIQTTNMHHLIKDYGCGSFRYISYLLRQILFYTH